MGRTFVALGAAIAVAGCGSSTHSNGGPDGSTNQTASSGGATASGGSVSAGGAPSTGGSGSGGRTGSTGGASSKGGTSSAGGASSTGAADGGSAEAAEVTRVSGWLKDTSSGLPGYAYTNIKQNFATTLAFDGLVHAIVLSCVEFAPKEPDWLEYCEAVLASAIVAESSYDPTANVLDSYGTRSVNGTTADDPTVGLLQIRFSSTVNSFNYYGPFDRMAALGCSWPAELVTQSNDAVFWATKGPSYLTFMEDPACNIGLSAWDYFSNATGNGGPTVEYTYQYCQGQGVGGDMVEGLLSHLEGPAYPRPADATNSYVTGIKSHFAALLGGLPTPDPFTEPLATEESKYCR